MSPISTWRAPPALSRVGPPTISAPPLAFVAALFGRSADRRQLRTRAPISHPPILQADHHPCWPPAAIRGLSWRRWSAAGASPSHCPWRLYRQNPATDRYDTTPIHHHRVHLDPPAIPTASRRMRTTATSPPLRWSRARLIYLYPPSTTISHLLRPAPTPATWVPTDSSPSYASASPRPPPAANWKAASRIGEPPAPGTPHLENDPRP